MKIGTTSLCLFLSIFGLLCCQRIETGNIIFSNVNIIAVENGEVMEAKDVVIEGNTIKTIVDHGSARFEGGQRINGTGKYLIPGLWDMHIHLRARKLSSKLSKLSKAKVYDYEEIIQENKDLLSLFIAHGVTSVHEMGTDIIDTLLVWRDQTESGQLLGPNLYLTGPKIEGHRFPAYAGSLIIEDEEDIKYAIDSLLTWDVDGVKIMGGEIDPELYHRVIEEADRAGFHTYTHNLEFISALEASGHGLDALAHMRGAGYESFKSYDALAGEMRSKGITPTHPEYSTYVEKMMERFDPGILQENLIQLAQNGTALISTLYYREYETRLNKYEEVFYAPLKFVGTSLRDQLESRYKRLENASQERLAFRKRMHENAMQMIKFLPESGITLLIGTDSGLGNRAPGTNFYYEMELLASHGLSNPYVLKAATWNAAEFMRKGDTEGSVEEGKKADLVLLNSNPLEDIQNLRNIRGVMRNGDWLDRDKLDRLLLELEEKYSEE